MRFLTQRRRSLKWFAGLIVLGALLSVQHAADAHAYPVKTQPANGDVLATPPQSVTIWFDETPIPAQTEIAVFDTNFNQVDQKDTHPAPQHPAELIVDLAAKLPAGTYTVRWSAVSATDGHHTSGAFVFAVGGPVAANAAAAAAAESSTASDPLLALVGWIDILALTTIGGGVLVGWLALRPAVKADRFPARPIRWLIIGAAGVALVNAVFGLFAGLLQTNDLATILKDQLWLAALSGTRYGAVWWLRVALTAAVVAWTLRWQGQPVPGRRYWALGAALSGGLLTTLSLNSHSAANALWPGLSVVVDWVHLAAASVWVGGLLTLTVTFPRLSIRERWDVLTRFSALATVCVGALALSGLYLAALELYQVEDLWQTDYGRWLCLKLALVAVMLGLGLNNNLALRRRLDEALTRLVQRRVLVESGLGIVVFLVVGFLTAAGPPTPPPQAADRTLTEYSTEGALTIALRISPNVPGNNSYTVRVSQNNQPLPTVDRVRINFVLPDRDVQTSWTTLTATADGRYTASGLDLSVVGDWRAQVDVRPTAESDDVRFVLPWTIDSGQLGFDPTQPRPANLVALALISTALVIIGWPRLLDALRGKYGKRLKQVSIGLIGLVAVAALGGTLVNAAVQQARSQGLPSVNPVPADNGSILRGQKLFQQICVACHGAAGLGDGPNAASMPVPPANLHVHVPLHTDAELYQFITQGYGAMPPIAAGLTPNQRWDIINYLRSLQADWQNP